MYKNKYRRISQLESADYLMTDDCTVDIYKTYNLPFRILKFKLENDIYETIITNFPAETFSKANIKQLYSQQWGIETSFRHLKYSLGLLNYHDIKIGSVYQ